MTEMQKMSKKLEGQLNSYGLSVKSPHFVPARD